MVGLFVLLISCTVAALLGFVLYTNLKPVKAVVGLKVRPVDRNNIGTISRIDGDNCFVFFRNKSTGAEATVKFHVSKLRAENQIAKLYVEKDVKNESVVDSVDETDKIIAELTIYLLNTYCNDISKFYFVESIGSEDDCDKMSDSLPLIYVWSMNESHYSLTVNTSVIAERLLAVMGRDDLRFVSVRDTVAMRINDLAIQSLITTIQSLGIHPSQFLVHWESRTI